MMVCAEAEREVDLYVSGDLLGDLEPCGCTSGQLGGLGRRVSYLRTALEAGRPALILENGDLTAGFGAQERLKFDTALAALRLCRADAVNVGERELYLKDAFWQTAARPDSPVFLSANVTRGDTALRPYLIRSFGALGVIVVGVLSPEAARPAVLLDPNIRVEPVVPALERLMPKLRVESDAVILLAQASRSEAKQYAALHWRVAQASRLSAVRRTTGTVALLFHAGDVEQAGEAERVGDTWVVSHGMSGRHVVKVTLRLGSRGAAPSATVQVQPLEDSLPEAREMGELMARYDDAMRDAGLVANWPRQPVAGNSYVGSTACVECHKPQYASWSRSRHVTAFETLVRRRRSHDPECVPCHTVGFGFETGYAGRAGPEGREHVGCESCHGPGAQHAKRPGRGYGAVTSQTCQSCHTTERDPRFSFEDDTAKMGHCRKLR